jgi:hypothetical protein
MALRGSAANGDDRRQQMRRFEVDICASPQSGQGFMFGWDFRRESNASAILSARGCEIIEPAGLFLINS